MADKTTTADVKRQQTDLEAEDTAKMQDYARRSYESTWRNDPEGRRKLEEKHGPLDVSNFGVKHPMRIGPSIRVYAQGGKVAPNNRFGFATPGKYTKR